MLSSDQSTKTEIKVYKPVIVGNGLRIHTIPKVAHSSFNILAREYNHYRADPYEEGPEDRFLVVRHPLDRLVSLYTFCCCRDISSPIEYYTKGLLFQQFLEAIKKHYLKNVHTIPQWYFRGPHKIKWIVKLEDLNTVWETVSQEYSMNLLGIVNKTIHDPWQDYYSKKDRQYFETLYQEDINLYEQTDVNPR